jgi:hypothetical protein
MNISSNTIVLDLETARSADDCRHCGSPFDSGNHALGIGHGFEKIGWDDKAALGLSIGCYWDYADSRIHWFDTPGLIEVIRLFVERMPLLVSFNGIGFDFPLLRELLLHASQTGFELSEAAVMAISFEALYTAPEFSYDILAEIWKVDPARKFEPGLNSLDAIAQANGLGAKLSHGAQAPRDWALGRYASVLNYCQDDVYKTKALFELIVSQGFILRGDGVAIALPSPGRHA